MNLYEISTNYKSLLDSIFDEETGEINESVMVSLNSTEDDLKNKGIAVASCIKNIEAERKAIEEAKKSMADREHRLDKRVSYLTNYLQSNMESCGITEISCPYFIVKLKKCPVSVDISDENSIPNDFKKIKEVISIDKIKIKEQILNGITVPGASLKQNNRLEIR